MLAAAALIAGGQHQDAAADEQGGKQRLHIRNAGGDNGRVIRQAFETIVP